MPEPLKRFNSHFGLRLRRDKLVVIPAVDFAENLRTAIRFPHRRRIPGKASSKLFFLQLLEYARNLKASQQRERIVGGRTKEIRNERIHTPKK